MMNFLAATQFMHDQFNKLMLLIFLGQKAATEDSYDNGQQKHQI
jgi:hypothetical protein